MIFETIGAVGDLKRLSSIAGVLLRFGFRDLFERSGLRRALEKAGVRPDIAKSESSTLESTPARVRAALEELGPTFVKLGQALASRSDLLPPEWTAELSRLHAHVTALPFDALRAQVQEDLGTDIEAAFASFDEEALAAGSMAQVHAATMHDGTDVVVKLRRPGIDKTVHADLRLLARLARFLEDEGGELRRLRPTRIVRDFARTMRAELDFRSEARNLALIARNLEAVDAVVLPRVISAFTRERLLVMTRLRGTSAADWLSGLRDVAFDARAMASLGTDVVLRMVFEDGVFHADPHPGNLLFLDTGRLGLLDFGQVAHLSEARRRDLLRILLGVASRDEDTIIDVLLEWSPGNDCEVDVLAGDVRAFIDRYYGAELQDLDVERLLLDLSEMVRENDLYLPADVAILVKVFLLLEGLGRALDPGFRLSSHIEPLARGLERRLLSKRSLMRRGANELRSLLMDLPRDVDRVLKRLRRGKLRLELDLERLEHFGERISSSANRLTIGMITAALIIGTAIAMTIDAGPRIFGIPALGLVGFVFSIVLGLGLLWSIWQSTRRRS